MEDLNQFKRYLGLSRHWFNQAVAYLKQPETKATLKEVRLIQKQDQPEWALDCPQRIREHAMNEACEAVKNSKIKCKKTGEYQEVHFRKKKDNIQRFGFDAQSLKDGSIFKQLLYKITFHPSEKGISELGGTKVVCEDHRWFLIIPQKRHIQRPENQRLPFVALDPGVRTFMSFYSPYVFGKIGDGDFKKIYRLCLGLDSLYSKMAVEPSKKRKFKLAAERQRWKIFDLIDDLHKKTAHFLVTRFSEIVIPSFETSQMVTKLRSKTARSMLTFAHYRFKQFLLAKAEEYSCKVRIVSEAYTSKTCFYCGRIQNIGSKKRFKCSCGVNADRDLQGARGIYLRALGALPWIEHLFYPTIVNQ
jgi:putative transposase